MNKGGCPSFSPDSEAHANRVAWRPAIRRHQGRGADDEVIVFPDSVLTRNAPWTMQVG